MFRHTYYSQYYCCRWLIKQIKNDNSRDQQYKWPIVFFETSLEPYIYKVQGLRDTLTIISWFIGLMTWHSSAHTARLLHRHRHITAFCNRQSFSIQFNLFQRKDMKMLEVNTWLRFSPPWCLSMIRRTLAAVDGGCLPVKLAMVAPGVWK